MSLVHTDSSWEQNRERSLGRHEYLLLRAGLPAGSRKSREFPKLQTYLALWASQPCVITKGFLFCRIRQWFQTLPSILRAGLSHLCLVIPDLNSRS